MLRRLLRHAATQVDRVAYAAMFSKKNTSKDSQRAESLSAADRIRALEHVRGLYDRPEHFETPDSFFAPPLAVSLRMSPVREIRSSKGLSGRVMDAVWTSPYAPYCEEVAKRYLSHEPNRTAAARLFLHNDKPRPTIFLLHGYGCGQFALEERLWPISWMFDRGLDVALFVLPFHAVRATKQSRPIFPSSDPRITIEGFRQAILDLRVLMQVCYDQGAPAVGAVGMSLGGYTTSLLATVERRLAFAVPMIPLASIADFARSGRRFVGTQEEQHRQYEALEQAYRVVSPLGRPRLVARESMLILGAKNDQITPIAHARRLAHHLDVPLEVFDGGHLLQFGRGDAFRSVGRLLGRLGLLASRE